MILTKIIPILILISMPIMSMARDFTPEECPIVGNTNSHIYHVAGGAFYGRMLVQNKGRDNRKCFNSEVKAVEAGYRRSKR